MRSMCVCERTRSEPKSAKYIWEFRMKAEAALTLHFWVCIRTDDYVYSHA